MKKDVETKQSALPNIKHTITEEDSHSNDGYIATPPRSSFSQPHQPQSPATPAEHFFLTSQLGLSGISGFALASNIRQAGRKNLSSRSSNSLASLGTEDFQSACGNLSEYDGDSEENNKIDSDDLTGLFGTDILVIGREPIQEVEEENQISPVNSLKLFHKQVQAIREDLKEVNTGTMDSKAAPTVVSPSVNKSPAPVVSEVGDRAHFDIAQHVYESVKGVWSFGRNIPVGGAILGLWEAAAVKVVDITLHKTAAECDAEIKPQLSHLDKDLVDPTITAVFDFFAPVVGKGKEALKPIIMAVLGIFPKQVEDEKDGGREEILIIPKDSEKEITMPEVSTPLAVN